MKIDVDIDVVVAATTVAGVVAPPTPKLNDARRISIEFYKIEQASFVLVSSIVVGKR